MRCFEKPAAREQPAWCGDCKREYDREYYHKTKQKRRTQKISNAKAIKKRNRTYVQEYLKGHPCVDCGEDDIIVLEFDHCRGYKLGNVGEMSARGFSIETLAEEIDKCDIRCANCHRRKTHKQLNYGM